MEYVVLVSGIAKPGQLIAIMGARFVAAVCVPAHTKLMCVHIGLLGCSVPHIQFETF